jgi:hypothetical protein
MEYDDSIIDSIAIGKPVQGFDKIPTELFLKLKDFLETYKKSIDYLGFAIENIKSKDISKFFGKSKKEVFHVTVSEKTIHAFQQIDNNFLKSVDYFEVQSFPKFQQLVDMCEKYPKDLKFLNYLAATNKNPLQLDIVLESLYQWDDYFLELDLPNLLQEIFINIQYILYSFLFPIFKGDYDKIDFKLANDMFSSIDESFQNIYQCSKKYVEKTPLYFKNVWKVSRFKRICNEFF